MSGHSAGGLSPGHAAELQAGDELDAEVRQKRLAQLEKDYQHSPLALEQLAIFNPESSYHDLMANYRLAAQAGDYVLCNEIDVVFARDFPCTESLYQHNHEW